MDTFQHLHELLQHLVDNYLKNSHCINKRYNRYIQALNQPSLFESGEEDIYQIRRPNIGVVTMTIGEEYQKVVQLALEGRESYCKQWGYTLINVTERLEPSRPIAWSKLTALLQHLDRFDYLIWLDADTVITNPSIPIELFLTLLPDNKSILIGQDFNGINSGVMFLRSNSTTKKFLTQIGEGTLYLDHIWWEQRSMLENLTLFKDEVEIISHKYSHLFNAYSPIFNQIAPFKLGDWCFHMAGVRDHGATKELINQIITFKEKKPQIFSRFPLDLVWLLIEVLGKRAPRLVALSPFIISEKRYYFETVPTFTVHLNHLNEICRESKEPVEGSCFTQHETGLPLGQLIPKQCNISSFGKIAKSVLEIGFNAGHSCLLFLASNPDSSVTVVDLVEHSYTKPCFDYLDSVFPNRLKLIQGDSQITLPKLVETEKGCFDLVHLDRGHETKIVESDLDCALQLSPTYIIVDDTQYPKIREIVDIAILQQFGSPVLVHATSAYQHQILKVNTELSCKNRINFD